MTLIIYINLYKSCHVTNFTRKIVLTNVGTDRIEKFGRFLVPFHFRAQKEESEDQLNPSWL